MLSVLLLLVSAVSATASDKQCLADFNAETQDVCQLFNELTQCRAELDSWREFIFKTYGDDASAGPSTRTLLFVAENQAFAMSTAQAVGGSGAYAEAYAFTAEKFGAMGVEVTSEQPLTFSYRYKIPTSGKVVTVPITGDNELNAVLQMTAGLDVVTIDVEHTEVIKLPTFADNSGAWSKVEDNWEVIYYVHDVVNVDDIPDTAAEIAAGFERENSFYIGNEELNNLDFDKVEMCVEHFGDWEDWSMCMDITDKIKAASDGPGGCATAWGQVEGNPRKTIVGLTGQCTRSAHVTLVGNNLPTCDSSVSDVNAEYGKAQPRCWTCQNGSGTYPAIYAATHNTWHYWGCGYSMWIEGFPSNTRNFGREVGHYQNGDCGCKTNSLNHWDTFYLRVHRA